MNTTFKTLRRAFAAVAALAVCVFFVSCGGGGKGKGKSDPDIVKLNGYTLYVEASHGASKFGLVSFTIRNGWTLNAKVVEPLPGDEESAYADVPADTVLSLQELRFKDRHMELSFSMTYSESMGTPVTELVNIQFTFPPTVDFRDMPDSFDFPYPENASFTRMPAEAVGVTPLNYEIPAVHGAYSR